MPALLTRKSSCPNSAATRATVASTASASVLSTPTPRPPRPSAARAAPSASMSSTATRAPSATNAPASERPMPPAAPVMIPARPSSCPLIRQPPRDGTPESRGRTNRGRARRGGDGGAWPASRRDLLPPRGLDYVVIEVCRAGHVPVVDDPEGGRHDHPPAGVAVVRLHRRVRPHHPL